MLSLIVALALTFAGDTLALQLSRNPYTMITVRSYYAVPTKNGHIDYEYNDAFDQQCVNAIFPHRGDRPCWYLRRHTEQEIKIDTGSKPEYPH